MRTKVVVGLLALLVLAFAACDQSTWFERFIPQEEEQFSRRYFALFRARAFKSIEARIDPSLKGDHLRPRLEQIAALFPAEKPIDVLTVGANTRVVHTGAGDEWQSTLTFQYEYPDKWLLASIALERKDDGLVVTGLNVQPIQDSIEHINRFTFEGKGLVHYGIFAVAILVPLCIVATLILCIRTPMRKRKWLWVIFILFGLVNVTLNWTSGGVNIAPFSLLLLGAGFWRSGLYGPVTISVSVPLGAIVFMLMRRRLTERNIQIQEMRDDATGSQRR